MLTVAEILAAIEQLPSREQQELSRIVLNRQIKNPVQSEIDSSKFWQQVERFQTETHLSEIDVNEIWGDVRDRSPGRAVNW